MIPIIFLSVALLISTGLVFLLGFRLGGDHWRSRVAEVRLEGARARRQMHELTRQAFVAMAEEAQARRPGSGASRSES